jgi:hypothetical protein
MKRAAIIGMGAFYLLLTTGMFVCIVHCAAANLFKKPSMSMANAGADKENKKHCADGKDCGCCKKHGEYTIKENIKPALDYQFSPVAVLANYTITPGDLLRKAIGNDFAWTERKAPPGKSGKEISIQFCSLQI